MSVRLFCTETRAIMYDSVTGWAFGPVFEESDEYLAPERAELFLHWLQGDVRLLTDNELEQKYTEFISKESDIWKEYEKEQKELYEEDEV